MTLARSEYSTQIRLASKFNSFSPLDIHECVRQALAVSHPAFIAKELKLTFTLEASKHQVFGDMTRLQQIFWNVFQNAAKFSRPNDSVTVSSHNPTDDRIVIEVTDIGFGIEPQILPKVFDAFEQGDSTSMRQYSGLRLVR